MVQRPLRVEHALDFLPDVDELRPLRLALFEAGSETMEAGSHGILETRTVSIEELRRRTTSLAEAVRQRAESSARALVEGLAALEAGDYAGASAGLVRAGEVHEEAGLHETALALYSRALEIGRKGRDRSGESLALRRIAWLRKERGELEDALRSYRALRQVAADRGDRESEIVALQGIGNTLVDQGRWEAARESYEIGLSLIDADSQPRLAWQLHNNLSIVARRSGDLDSARAWLRSARALAGADAASSAEVYLANAEGMIEMAAGNPAAAETRYRAALGLADSPGTRATLLVNLADSLVALRRIVEAEAAAREIEAIVLAHGLATFLPHAYRALGAAARARLDEDGFVFYEQALHLCSQLGAPPFEIAVTHFEYAAFEAALGRSEAASSRFEVAAAMFADLGAEPDRRRAAEAAAALPPDSDT